MKIFDSQNETQKPSSEIINNKKVKEIEFKIEKEEIEKNIIIEKVQKSIDNDEKKNRPKSNIKFLITNPKEVNKEDKENNIPSKLYIPSLFKVEDEIKEYICPLCNTVFDEPTMELCGCHKIFCKNCLKEYLAKNNNKCPFSKKAIIQQPQNVPVINYTISLLEMKCRNYINGCSWKGKCKEYKEHLKKYCLKEKVACPNRGCKQLIMKEDIIKHSKECEYRLILCKLCNIKIQYIDKKGHEDLCNNIEVNCPHGCGEKIKRNKLQSHFYDCPKKIFDCPFCTFGCKEKLVKNDLEKHKLKAVNQHLLLLGERILKNEENIKNLFKLIENKSDISTNSIKEKERDSSHSNQSISIVSITQNINDSKQAKHQIHNKNEGTPLKTPEKNTTENIYNNNLKLNDLIINESPKRALLKNKRKNSNLENKSAKNLYINHEFKSQISLDEKYYENYFDMKYIPKSKFKIDRNTIIAKNMNNKIHNYIFASEKYDIKKDSFKQFRIFIKLNNSVHWLAFGICDKKIVKENNFNFLPSRKNNEKERNNGCYILSMSSMIWNSNNSMECKKLRIDSNLGREGNEIEFRFIPNRNSMEYYMENKLLAELTNIKLFKSDVYTPCIIFLQNCSVTVKYDYPN